MAGIITLYQDNPLPEVVHFCSRCEQFVDAPICPICNQAAARIRRNTANNVLWAENLERLRQWIEAGRIIPEVE